MKRNDWIIFLSTILYSILFYKEGAGINFLIFNVAIIVLLLVRDITVITSRSWMLCALSSILTSAFIVIHHSTLSIVANIISISLLANYSWERSSSLFFAGVYSIYSYASSIVFMVIDYAEKANKKKEASSVPVHTKVLLILIPILVAILFFVMYRTANPIFKDFTKDISLDFITWSWVRFTIGGFILLYALFKQRFFPVFVKTDTSALNDLLENRLPAREEKGIGKTLSLSLERLSGMVLLILLNLLLVSVNLLDVVYLWLQKELPESLTFSESVHQGVNMIITSVIFAVAIILVYFRGHLNFDSKSKILKALAYVWIVQNAFMIISTMLRNHLYIDEYGLTYKRIGVYVYLLLTLIGLATVFIKLLKVKSNWFLFRVNGWAFFAVLILSCTVNWDLFITRYNTNLAVKEHKVIEKKYLLSLSSSNIPELIKLEEMDVDSMVVAHKYYDFYFNRLDPWSWSNVNYTTPYQELLQRKIAYFLFQEEKQSWLSWNYREQYVHEFIVQRNTEGKLIHFNLEKMDIENLDALSELSNMNELNLRMNRLVSSEGIDKLSKLERLDLSKNPLKDISGITDLKFLKSLSLEGTRISDLSGLEKLTSLESLNLNDLEIEDYSPLYELRNLRSLRIKRTSDNNLETLKEQLPNTRIYESRYSNR